MKVHAEVLAGKPDDEIVRYADKIDVSLIAIASRGRVAASRIAGEFGEL